MGHYDVPHLHRRQARRMRKTLPAAELAFWNTVRAERLMGLSFRRQMPIAGFIVDFACPAYKLIIEIDGPSHSFNRQIEDDRGRDEKLGRLGWTVLRYTNEDVLKNMDAVSLHILRTIGMERFE